MRHLVLGTAGHIDHGKTALVRALTGQDTDRLPEEKRRGITIDLGFALLPLPASEFAVVDVPGHESLVRNMLAGATGIDVMLLVVAADEGVMPQTREHLAIMDLLGVREAVIAVTKVDLVAADWLDLVRDEVRRELAGSAYAAAPVVEVSAITGDGLDRLRAELAAAAARCPVRPADDLFRMPVDRVFTVRGTGTVATGTIWSGQVGAEATLRALPGNQSVRVRGLQRHGVPAASAAAGERVALALAVPLDALGRGSTLVDDDAWQPASILTIDLRLLPDAPPLKARQRVRFHLGTAETLARVAMPGRDALAPGDNTWGQLRLEAPIVARAGDRFVIRSYSPVRTIGGGRIAEPVAPKRKRLPADTMTHLAAINGLGDRVTAAVQLAGPAGVLRHFLPVLTGMAPAAIRAAAPDGVYAAGDRLYPADLARGLRERLTATIAAFHRARPLEPGIPRDEVKRAAPAPAHLIDAVLRDLAAAGEIAGKGATYALPGFKPALSPENLRLADELSAALAAAGLAAPRFAELPESLRARPELPAVARLLAEQGRLVMLAHDHPADARAVAAAAAALLAALREHPRQSASSLKEVLGLTRKHLIPLLEYFDRVGITSRVGDERVAGPGAETVSGGSG